MRKLGYSIINLIQLIRFFGPASGFVVYLKIVFGGTLVRINPSKFKNSVEIRKKDSDLPIFYQVFSELQYDITFFIPFKPVNIIDGGSNVGYSCLYFASVFPDAKIVAVEPEQNNYKQLCKNVSGYQNITTVNAGIWHETGNLQIKKQDEWSASFEVVTSTSEEGTLKAYTINELMQLANINEIDILKIDIEGAEYHLFANNPHTWLSKTKCLIIELHDNLMPGTSQVFFREMAKYNWRTYIRGENIICFRDNP